jgi:uncharacterized FAD-dependent dehydrogenase
MKKRYDAVIVGAGPAGIFTALELVKQNNLKVLLIEKGPDIDKRDRRSVNSGWGGSGAFSDGKLILSTEVGGWLTEYISESALSKLIDHVDSLYADFGGKSEKFGVDADAFLELHMKAQLAELTLLQVAVRHLGTDKCTEVLKSIYKYLSPRIDIMTGTTVQEVLVKKDKAAGVITDDGTVYESGKVILAPGRSGSQWLADEATRIGLDLSVNPVDLGVRVEVPAAVMEPLTSKLYESKLIYHSAHFDDKVRTFCMNPYGEVTIERYSDNVITVNGHSYASRATDKTNFALLVSTTFTEPFKEPNAYGKYIARLANLLGEGIIIQRLGDLIEGRRSTADRIARSTVTPSLKEATPGDLSFVLPYRYISDILEMLEAMDKLVPGVFTRNTLLYGVEAKFYSQRLKLTSGLMTDIEGLYAIGDGAGITRGLIQASAAGVIAARDVLKNT